MLRFVALTVALLLPATLPAAALGPLGDPGGLDVVTPAYSATLTWPAVLTSAEPLATLRVDMGDRTGTMAFEARHRSDVFLRADTNLRPLLVSAQVTPGAVPRVALLYDFAATGALPETSSTLTFAFHADHIEYETTLRAPSGAFASYMEFVTTLTWDRSFDARGVILPDATTLDDDGAALQPYQEWQNATRYGIHVEDTGGPAAAQARIAQGTAVNYLADGAWRVTTSELRSSTVFNTFLDAPTADSPIALWTRDALLFGSTLADAIALFTDLAVPDPLASRASQDAQVVIALMDSGINPYHAAFRDDSPLGQQHPSTYIAGYPAEAEAVQLTLDAPDLATALALDDAIWRSLDPDKLYWFPGTKVVGGISTGVSNETPGVIFSVGHGTMTASRAAANEYSLCPECRIVVIQAGDILDGGESGAYVRWAADQPWIDVQSHSWSGAVPFNNDVEVPGIRAASEYAAAQMPFFASAGNGVSGKAGVLGHPAFTRPMSGARGVIPVGGHDNGFVTAWTAQYPYVAADACASWAAVGDSMHTFDPEVGSGTSASTPYTAGEAGRIILEARRILGGPGDRSAGILAQGAPPPGLGPSPLADGDLTLDELKAVLFRTATARPAFTRDDGFACGAMSTPSNTLPVAWTSVPGDVNAYPFIGWGGIDVTSRDRALAVLRGAPMPVRPADEQAHAKAETLRAGYWSVEPDTPGVPHVEQDDAGSGQDAPGDGDFARAIPIQSGVVYDGTLLGELDPVDAYAFEGRAGDEVEVRLRGMLPCATVYAPSGEAVANATCAVPLYGEMVESTQTVILAESGVHVLRVANILNPTTYGFSIGVNIGAPEPGDLPSTAAARGNDDAGTGDDAPERTFGAPTIQPGVVYEASLGPMQLVDTDVYAFSASAGQVIRVLARGAYVCVDVVHGATGDVIAGRCNYAGLDHESIGIFDDPIQATAPAGGAYYLRFTGMSTYAFGFGLDSPAPALQWPAL